MSGRALNFYAFVMDRPPEIELLFGENRISPLVEMSLASRGFPGWKYLFVGRHHSRLEKVGGMGFSQRSIGPTEVRTWSKFSEVELNEIQECFGRVSLSPKWDTCAFDGSDGCLRISSGTGRGHVEIEWTSTPQSTWEGLVGEALKLFERIDENVTERQERKVEDWKCSVLAEDGEL